MEKIKVSGKVAYQNLGTGFWGIIGNDGKKWRPVNMPEQLKTEGKPVIITVEEIHDDFSIEMWGTTVKIIRFET